MMKYPAWMGPKGGDPIWVRNEQEAQEGWVEHFGKYNVQTGQWEPQDPLDHDKDGEKGGSVTAGGDDINALRAAYKDKFGKRAFNGWDETKLREKLS